MQIEREVEKIFSMQNNSPQAHKKRTRFLAKIKRRHYSETMTGTFVEEEAIYRSDAASESFATTDKGTMFLLEEKEREFNLKIKEIKKKEKIFRELRIIYYLKRGVKND